MRQQQRCRCCFQKVAGNAAEQRFAQTRPAKGTHDDQPWLNGLCDTFECLLDAVRRASLFMEKFGVEPVTRQLDKRVLGRYWTLVRADRHHDDALGVADQGHRGA